MAPPQPAYAAPPTAGDNTVSAIQDKDYVFTVADFKYNDPDGDKLNHVQITAGLFKGTLYNDVNSDKKYYFRSI
ncbi:hypothetical protein ACFLXQ_08125 [Chloroflexota bacterium]